MESLIQILPCLFALISVNQNAILDSQVLSLGIVIVIVEVLITEVVVVGA